MMKQAHMIVRIDASRHVRGVSEHAIDEAPGQRVAARPPMPSAAATTIQRRDRCNQRTTGAPEGLKEPLFWHIDRFDSAERARTAAGPATFRSMRKASPGSCDWCGPIQPADVHLMAGAPGRIAGDQQAVAWCASARTAGEEQPRRQATLVASSRRESVSAHAAEWNRRKDQRGLHARDAPRPVRVA
jgi:hypothetical protein